MESKQEKDPLAPLKKEIRELGEILGAIISEDYGAAALERVEQVRRLSRRSEAEGGSLDALEILLRDTPPDELHLFIRAFAVFLELSNVAEDRHRIRTLRKREALSDSAPLEETPAAAVGQLQKSLTAEQFRDALGRLDLELVLTAHPTEAKRRSVRARLQAIRSHLDILDQPELLPRERRIQQARLQQEIKKLWHTEMVRPWRPTVLEEVQRALAVKRVLWEAAPNVLRELRTAIAEHWPQSDAEVRQVIRFGTWIGGDRDGHPGVTSEVTAKTLVWLRDNALRMHRHACQNLLDSLTMACPPGRGEALEAAIDLFARQDREVARRLERIPQRELFLRWLRVMDARLESALSIAEDEGNCSLAYCNATELEADILRLISALKECGFASLAEDEVQPWLDQTRAFGFHLARLDIRENTRSLTRTLTEVFRAAGLCEDYSLLGSQARVDLLRQNVSPAWRQSISSFTRESQDLLESISVHRAHAQRYGEHAQGAFVISMTHDASDVLGALWLWQAMADEPGGSLQRAFVPLLETIADLRGGASILKELWEDPVYRRVLEQQDNKQWVMIGYSDSTKDGGYFAACWALHEAQAALHELAQKYGIQLVFFHGRGGALGRGGGPTARAVRSLPYHTFRGALRVTEQGEVLAERYMDEAIAQRNFSQLISSALLHAALPGAPLETSHRQLAGWLADWSFQEYRALVEEPGFVDFFRLSTPVETIENLPIGSRPARRTGSRSLSDLRAIPWVFAWTQVRCLIPAWYGLGKAFERLRVDRPSLYRELPNLYQEWPFLQATVDNAALALAKSDLAITERYGRLPDASEVLRRISQRISSEYDRSVQAVLHMTGRSELLAELPWLQQSIQVRKGYVDPLNLIQIELLRRLRNSPAEDREHLHYLARLAIKGIAAGMRNTG